MNDTPIKALIAGQTYIVQNKYGLIDSELYIFIKHVNLPSSTQMYAQFFLFNTDTTFTLGENEWKFYIYKEKV
jgi:hypothetical protein